VGSESRPATRGTSAPSNGISAIVGIGASEGGLDAFTQLLEHLPRDTGMAFILIQHLDPKHPSVPAGASKADSGHVPLRTRAARLPAAGPGGELLRLWSAVLCGRRRRSDGYVPAVALTALATEDDQRRSLAAGFQMHLTKPVDSDRLAAALIDLAGSSTIARPTTTQARGSSRPLV